MCGIAGYIHFDRSRSTDINKLKRMTDVIAYRGPDSEGHYIENNYAFGHRQLSIIDLQTGNQPMISDDQNIILTFNGEIYNYIELKEQLIKKGHIFTSNSDTEVIIKAYKEWGIDCQNKFNGMWVFSLFDKKLNTLFISRDRLGEKPLHYTIYDNSLIYGSEIKSIKEYGVPLNANLELLELYLFYTYIPAPYTFYKDIFKLLPGHYLSLQNGKIREIKYWDLPSIDESNMENNKNQINEYFQELFEDSVKIRMRSAVPYGAFLSGGLDSSSIVSVMSKLNSKPIETFTIGFKDKMFDESILANKVAKQFNTNHHLNYVMQDSFESALKDLAYFFDEPFGDSSVIPTSFISKIASEKVKMVITGDGGDEILSGYNSYLGLKLTEKYRSLPTLIKNNLPKLINNISPLTSNRVRYKLNKFYNFSSHANLDYNTRMIMKMAYTDYGTIKSLIGDRKVYTIEDHVSDFHNKIPLKDDFYKLMFFDLKEKLPNDYLTKVDRMSMSHSIEARLPFLDYRLVEFMSKVDKKIKLNGLEKKSILRETIGKNLPKEVLNAPKKGFGVPLREWFKEDGFNNYFSCLKEFKELNNNVINHIVLENKRGEKDNGNFIWCLLMLKKFL